MVYLDGGDRGFKSHMDRFYGGIGEGVNTPVCGSGTHGFESHIPPHHGGLAQLGEHLPYKQEVTGSSPVSSIDNVQKKVNRLIEVGSLFCLFITHLA